MCECTASNIFLKNVNNVKNTDDIDDSKNQIKEKISKKINYEKNYT